MSINHSLLDAPLLGVELNYFRTAPDDWELLLVRMRQLGATTITTAVPWSWHAPAPGTVDLHGVTHPQRDLVGFVTLCARLGLALMLQPGPFVAAGVRGGGIPDWLFRPEIAALRPDGQPWRTSDGSPHICALHPIFLQAVHEWIATFSAVLSPFQTSKGPVIALQIDHQAFGDVVDAEGVVDRRFRHDYHPVIATERWLEWLLVRFAPEDADPRKALDALNDAWGTRYSDLAAVELPRFWRPPQQLGALRRYIDAERFHEAVRLGGVATIMRLLRVAGWNVPFLHNIHSWKANIAELAQSNDLFASDSSKALPSFLSDAQDQWKNYIDQTHWRSKLLRGSSAQRSVVASGLDLVDDFAFAAPLLAACNGLMIDAGVQCSSERPELATSMRWAMHAPVRADGSVRQRFWHAKNVMILLDTLDGDVACSRAPVDVAIGYSHEPDRLSLWQGEATEVSTNLVNGDYSARCQRLTQQLVEDGITFAVVDLDTTPLEELKRYRLLLVPGAPAVKRTTQDKLTQLDHVVFVGETALRYDENLESWRHPALDRAMRLPTKLDGEQIEGLVETWGGHGRYAWADQPDVDALVRYGAAGGDQALVYLWIANRRDQAYNGLIAYRAPDESIEHVNVSLGPQRIGLLVLRAGEVLGASLGGEVAEGSWLVRGMQTSIVWSGGPALVAPYELVDGEASVLFMSSPVGGRLNLRRPSGWEGLVGYRLLLDGSVLPIDITVENSHLIVSYIAEDRAGQSDGVILCAADTPLPTRLRAYLNTQLQARISMLSRSAAILEPMANDTIVERQALQEDLALLSDLVSQPYSAEAYRVAIQDVTRHIDLMMNTLHRRLAMLRTVSQSHTDSQHTDALERVLTILIRAGLALDRE